MLRRYQTVDVFTETLFGGNPLAVVLDGDGLSDAQMQAIAREFNYSETTFVRRPRDPQHTAEVKIYTPANEVPFAGHPNVGTAYVLAACEPTHAGRDTFIFEELAGLVPVRLIREAGSVRFAQLTAPEPLSFGSSFSREQIAACLCLEPGDIELTRHEPRIASVGLPFIVVEVSSHDALQLAKVNRLALEQILPTEGADAIYFYSRELAERDGAVDLTARMFAPFDGLPEDPATGSATGAVTAMLASFPDIGDGVLPFTVAQGIDMGRPSLLAVEIEKAGGRIVATRIGGACVLVMSGVIEV